MRLVAVPMIRALHNGGVMMFKRLDKAFRRAYVIGDWQRAYRIAWIIEARYNLALVEYGWITREQFEAQY